MSFWRSIVVTSVGALAVAACAGATKPADPPSPPARSGYTDAGATPFVVTDDSDDAGPSVTCGATVCSGHFVPFFDAPLRACCPADAPTRCGVDLREIAKTAKLDIGCAELDQPGARDPACPSSGIGPLPAGTFPACRKASGVCGVQVSMPNVIDFGCVDVASIHPLGAGGAAPPTTTKAVGDGGALPPSATPSAADAGPPSAAFGL